VVAHSGPWFRSCGSCSSCSSSHHNCACGEKACTSGYHIPTLGTIRRGSPCVTARIIPAGWERTMFIVSFPLSHIHETDHFLAFHHLDGRRSLVFSNSRLPLRMHSYSASFLYTQYYHAIREALASCGFVPRGPDTPLHSLSIERHPFQRNLSCGIGPAEWVADGCVRLASHTYN